MLSLLRKLFKRSTNGNDRHSIEEMIPGYCHYARRDDLLRAGEAARPQGEFRGNPMAVLSVPQKLALLPKLVRNYLELRRSLQGLEDSPPPATLPETERERLEDYARSCGVLHIGYTGIDRNDIFQDRGVLFDKAIVFCIEMDLDEIRQAPSFQTLQMIQQTYAQTGKVANGLTAYLRGRGYAAQAGPGLGGHTIYPLLAYKAGLGKFGRHGNLLVDQVGARHRLGVVYTSITNLPVAQVSLAEPVHPFCEKCGRCIRECPAKAIHEAPVPTTPGNIEFIDNGKCVEYFAAHYGCTICIKVCPLSSAKGEQVLTRERQSIRNGLK